VHCPEQAEALRWAGAPSANRSVRGRDFIYQQVPQLAAGFQQALWGSPQVAQCAEIRALMAALRPFAAVRCILPLLEKHPVYSALLEQGQGSGGELPGARSAMQAWNAVVLAAGAWSGECLRQVVLALAVAAVKGPMMILCPMTAHPGLVAEQWWLVFYGRMPFLGRDGEHNPLRVLLGACGLHKGRPQPKPLASPWQASANTPNCCLRLAEPSGPGWPVGTGLRAGVRLEGCALYRPGARL